MFKLVVLVSGSGSNLQAIIEAIASGQLACQISLVIADRKCSALDKAHAAKIPTHLLAQKTYANNLSSAIHQLIPANSQLIVLAGFLSILDTQFINAWQHKIINIHPSILPLHGGAGMWGLKVHQAALASGAKYSGCTVHYVSDEIDGGEIIQQQPVPILATDDAQTLQQRVLYSEHQLLVSVIQKLILSVK